MKGRNLKIQNHFLDILGLEKEPKRNFVLLKGTKERIGTLEGDKQNFELDAKIQGRQIEAYKKNKEEISQVHFKITDIATNHFEIMGIQYLKGVRSLKHALSWITFYDGAFLSEVDINAQILGTNQLLSLRTTEHSITITEEKAANFYERKANHTKTYHITHEIGKEKIFQTRYSPDTKFVFFDWNRENRKNVFDEKDLWFIRRILKSDDPSYYKELTRQIYLSKLGEESLYLNGVSKCFENREEAFRKVLFNCYK